MGDGMGWWMIWGSLMMIVFWGGVIALAVWGVQSLTGREQAPPQAGREQPLEIAKQRYARGDITREEFEQMKRDLEGAA